MNPTHIRRKQLCTRICFAGLLLILVSSSAQANAGTMLMWASMFHLFIGNAFIGVWESFIASVALYRFGKEDIPGLSGPALIVLGNYASCVAGVSLIWLGQATIPHLASPLYMLLPLTIGLTILSFLLSVLVEWPFFYRAVGKRADRKRLSLRLTVIAQAGSYIFMIPLYAFLSGNISLFTQPRVTRHPDFAREPYALVYYIGAEDGDIWQMRTNGKGRRRVMPENLNDSESRLFVLREGRIASLCTCDPRNPQEPRRLFRLPSGTRFAHRRDGRDDSARDNWMAFGALDLRPDEARTWEAKASFWPSPGLSVTYRDQPRYPLGLELPFVQIFSRNVTNMPNDQVIYQMGDEILLLDMPTGKLARLTRGRGPVVVLGPEEEARR